ncbi:response regulator [Gracilibacillus caseinilyticus]|uniref:Response regulator n=1 Tax=Gracilibacillus caseinilyticus TaxID=2932256 RepID=A0ABY4EUW0_9BACI|nr:response regulator [Gracilibacillus caseinilyticus]UOQ48202.1 response regulator [Gracilibacillus caseinilyticus]
MYKVLLVDDERMILDGISTIVDWNKYQTQLIGKAINGLEAYDFITKNQPDIVITDITMPGLDGLQLVKKAQMEYPEIKWIFISGYNEFEYARQAMRFGVKHYLLKPCNEDNIAEALADVVQEKQQEEQSSAYVKEMEEENAKIMINEYEEALKQLFTHPQQNLNAVTKLKSIMEELYKGESCLFAMIYMKEKVAYDQLVSLKHSIKSTFLHESVLANIIDNKIMLLMRSNDCDHLKQFLQDEEMLHHFTHTTVTTGAFSRHNIQGIPSLEEMNFQVFYRTKQQFIDHKRWYPYLNRTVQSIDFSFEKILNCMREGKKPEMIAYFQQLEEELREHYVLPKRARGYFIQIYLFIVQRLSHRSTEDHIQVISEMEDYHHVTDFTVFFGQLYDRLIQMSSQESKYSKTVKQMLGFIEEEIANPELSLQWIANHRLFMNADYLGKTFKKETGKGFSAFLTNTRINKAIEIIEIEGDIKVFELAERLGFGNNPQYFSQIFKKMKGYSPSERIKSG